MTNRFSGFETIEFEQHGGKFGEQLGLRMPGNYWVPRDDIKFAWENATKRLPFINWQQKVMSKAFFDLDDWNSFKYGKKLVLGRCIKYFSTHEMLPIEVANPNKKGSRIYKKAKN